MYHYYYNLKFDTYTDKASKNEKQNNFVLVIVHHSNSYIFTIRGVLN
jgi:hypothetical protein